MGTDEGEPRVYGGADAEKQLPPATEGMRGEGLSAALKVKPEQTRTVDVDGKSIEVAETSGAAFAEASGAALKKD
jgi:hypothetical protein